MSVHGGGIVHLERKMTRVIQALKRGKISGSYAVSCTTAEIMRLVVVTTQWANARKLIANIKYYGQRLIEARPLELAIGNTVRRILYLIREEYTNSQLETEEREELRRSAENPQKAGNALPPDSPLARRSLSQVGDFAIRRQTSRHLDPAASFPSLTRVFEGGDINVKPDLTRSYANLKQSILDAINDMIEELSLLYKNIADQAIEHVHANEVIMTFGKSRTVEEFLKSAAKTRKFQVIVAESSPSNCGHEMALALSKAGIDTTLIPDSAIFAIMARVNKVIVGTHSVLANGGLLALSGMHMLALAAKHHSVPFVVCCGLYKLCPMYAHDQDTFNELQSPGAIFQYSDAQKLGSVCVKNPTWDYIPPELVSLYITNGPQGGHSPSYIYRLLAEYYHPEDMDLTADQEEEPIDK